jgi:hypothetical protein
MINCRNCVHWTDEDLGAVEADQSGQPHLFMGCRIYGFMQNTELESCKDYVESDNLFTLCRSCGIPVPKVCISLGECVNCTDTDLFCVENCIGGENRKFCTHFVRLRTKGIQLINDQEVFDLFPTQDMPGNAEPVEILEPEETESMDPEK